MPAQNFAPQPVDDAAIADLRARLAATHRVADPWREQPDRGFGPDRVAPLLARWADGYDWRAAEDRIRALPWTVAGDEPMRLVHSRAADPDAPTVVLLHGWPDSVLRFERLLPLLADVHVVAPALAGFPFALERTAPTSVHDQARMIAGVLDGLGVQRAVLSGGDVGGDVAELLAGERPELVAALHLTNISPRHAIAVDPASLDDEGRAFVASRPAWLRSHGGYIAEQSTKPRTLLAGLGDSPAGLAAWLLEKITDWSGDAAASFSDDELLTWVAAYWFTGCIGTSFGPYAEPARMPDRTTVPTVLSSFADDLKPEPESYAARFVDLREFVQHGTGGHFAAWEQPEAYAADLRLAIALAA